MPLYNYRCRKCETEFDIRQSFSEDPLTDCQTCATHGSVYRVIQPAGVVFKGSGFYVTDTKSAQDSLRGNGKKDSSATSSNENGKSADSKSTDSASSDTKTSTTTPPPAKSDSASASTSPAN